jgi:hypothetical protein
MGIWPVYEDDIPTKEAMSTIKRMYGPEGFIRMTPGCVVIGRKEGSVYVEHARGVTFIEALKTLDNWRVYLNAKYRRMLF